MKDYESIQVTKQEFEESFSNDSFYNKQTQDVDHLESILSFLPIKSGMKILDLGVGSGFLSFGLAKRFPGVSIIGLDIVEKALEKNRDRALKEGISNVTFTSYDGMEFPFEEGAFDLVITRYALHHFPDIQRSIKEVRRVLKAGGYLFISDPTPNDNDVERFVDAYMQMKKDGHIKFYSKKEWCDICQKEGLVFCKSFDSEITFPKKRETAIGFEQLLKNYNEEIIKGYDVKVIGNEIYITEK